MRHSSRSNSAESPRTPTSAATCSNSSPISPGQAVDEGRPEARLHTCQPQPASDPAIAGAECAFFADGAVEGVGGAVARMIDPLRTAFWIEREIGADRGPEAAIFLRPKPDLPSGIVWARNIFDVHHALAAAERRPDRPRSNVPPGWRLEIDPLLSRSESDPSRRWLK